MATPGGMSRSEAKHAPQPLAPTRSKEERSLVRRLDVFLLVFGCISQIIKFLDQSNINNAYVSGMKEDLGLMGNELNFFTTYFNVAYCVMLIPSQVIMTYVRPSWWLPSLEVVWGIITGLVAMTTSARQVYVLRVFLGLCESAAYPGMITLFMSWYTPLEMARRIGFYHSCQAVGQMMWLFVVNAIITVVWGFAGYFMIPDNPRNPNPWAFWFKRVHAECALHRLERGNRLDVRPITWAAAKRTFSTWLVYVVGVMYMAMVLGTSGCNYFGLFLKSIMNSDGLPRWTTVQVNLIPIGGSAINVVFVWIWAFLSDLLRTRWTLIVAQASIAIVVAIMLTIWTIDPSGTPLSSAYAAYFMSHVPLGTAPLIWAWLSDLAPQEPEERSLTVGAAIAGYYSISAWSQVLVWPASQAPYYKYGWQSSIALCALVVALAVALRIVDVRYLKPQRRAISNVEEPKPESRVENRSV
ncbi:Major facilitator superfamily transporter [Metarhizium rileyi]|uniref:Major facilitator superfamily transporter n=1 Tax=Metarhizium rileyi (strain RCEF 4871) TaxID=1649241 RepID=A0A166WNZ7_METRR|nr:Major facilitator superfamily transporter [Metarhizium rileyi RCEF 4871]